MKERGLIFIDVDENCLELWLKPDRVQLVVVDGRPELEAGELHRFASVLFAEYVGCDLAARLEAARRRLCEARERIAGAELAQVIDRALHAIDDVSAMVASAEATAAWGDEAPSDDDAGSSAAGEPAFIAPTLPASFDVPASAVPEDLPDPPGSLTIRPAHQPYRTIASILRGQRGSRARDSSVPRWGSGAATATATATSYACRQK